MAIVILVMAAFLTGGIFLLRSGSHDEDWYKEDNNADS